jgi:hypothetical protein
MVRSSLGSLSGWPFHLGMPLTSRESEQSSGGKIDRCTGVGGEGYPDLLYPDLAPIGCGAPVVSEVSTRLWFEEPLWDAVSRRAIAEGTTVRELAPRLIEAGLRGAAHGSALPTTPAAPAPAAAPTPLTPTPTPPQPAPATDAALALDRPPIVVMSELYTCGVCNAELKLGAVSQHVNRHLKEHLAAQAARS